MSNEGTEIEVYGFENYLVKKATLRGVTEPKVLEELLSIGGGSFKISTRDRQIVKNPSLIKSRNVIKHRVDGKVIGAWLTSTREAVTLTENHAEEGYEIAGPGLKAWLDDAGVHPRGGFKATSKDHRSFSFASERGSWYIPGDWIDPFIINTVLGKSWQYSPDKWPTGATQAKWIWGTANSNSSAAQGLNYFRVEIPSVTVTTEYKLYIAADDNYTVYLDGEEVARTDDPIDNYKEASKITLEMEPGSHVIGIRVQNVGKFAGLVAALYRVTDRTPPVQVRSVAIPIGTTPTITGAAHGLTNGTRVYLTTTGTLPGGLSPNTNYYVIQATTNTFKLAKSAGGASINTSGSQSGSHVINRAEVASVEKLVTYSGMSVTALNAAVTAAQNTVNTRTTTYNNLPAGNPKGNNTQKKQAKAKATALANLNTAKQALSTITAERTVAQAAVTAQITWKVLPYPAKAPGWSPGEILIKLLSEAAARNVRMASVITPNFTATLDSAGQVWNEPIDWTFDVGKDTILSVATKLEEMGCDIWIDPDTYQLNVVNKRGVDRSVNTGDGAWAVRRVNSNSNPKPSVFAGSGYSVPGTGSITSDGVTVTLTSVTTPYIFSAGRVGGATLGRIYAIRAKIKGVPVSGQTNPTLGNVRPHKRTGNVYYNPDGGAIFVPLDGNQYSVEFFWTATANITEAEIFDLTVVGNGGGPIGYKLSIDEIYMEDVGTVKPDSVNSFFYHGSTPPDNLTRYSLSGGVSVMETQGVSASPVIFRAGKNLRRTAISSKGKIKNSLAVKTQLGWQAIPEQDAASVALYGALEGSLDTNASPSLSKSLASLIFVQRATEEEGATYDVFLPPEGIVPHKDFFVGDWVLAPNEQGLLVKRRIMSISTEKTNRGRALYTLEFDTIFRDNEERINRVLEKLGGNGVSSGYANAGGVGSTSPSAPVIIPPSTIEPGTETIPDAPTDLEVFSIGYWSANGVTAYSQVNLTWAPVVQNTDETEMIPSYYEVWGRPTASTEDAWVLVTTTTEPMATMDGFTPGEEWSFYVIAWNGTRGSERSEQVVHTTEGPDDPLIAPFKPFGASASGLLVLTWNGLMSDGNPPAPQFRYIYAEVQVGGVGSWTPLGTVLDRDGRNMTLPGLPIGTSITARFIAVDGAGLKSTPSEVSDPVIIKGVDLGDLEQAVEDAIEAAKQAGLAAREQLNMLNDPSFELNTNEFWAYGTGVTNVATGARTGTRRINIAAGSAREVLNYQRPIPCEEGDTFYLRVYIDPQGTPETDDKLIIGIKSGTTETLNVSTNVIPSGALAGVGWNKVEGSWTVPAGIKFFSPFLYVGTSAIQYWVDDFRLLRMTGEVDIVAGSVNADAIAADAIRGRHIQAEAIDADKLQSDSVATRHLQAEAVDAENIKSRAVKADHVDAGAIKTQHISPEVGSELNIESNTSINFVVGEVNAVRDGLEATDGELELMQTYYKFGPDGAEITKPGSVFALELKNDMINILENGNVVSFWNSGTLYVNQFVGERVSLGNHQLAKFEDGTVVRWLGV